MDRLIIQSISSRLGSMLVLLSQIDRLKNAVFVDSPSLFHQCIFSSKKGVGHYPEFLPQSAAGGCDQGSCQLVIYKVSNPSLRLTG